MINKSRLAIAVTLPFLAAGCGAGAEPGGDGTEAPAQTLTVFAAASLQNSFTELGESFERTREGTTVTFNFAGSSDLVTQLQQGAPADVFASANTQNMDRATGDNLIMGEPVDFAANTLQIAVPADNPAQIMSFADLAKPGVKVVVCAPQVPCGAATEKVAQTTGVELSPVSEENAVTDVLNKVQTGEADAGLVYRTDVQGAGENVQGIEFPEAESAVNIYPIAVLSGSQNPQLAQEFVDLITGPEGQQVLATAGFDAP